MTRLPRVTGKEIIKGLKRAGFEVIRTRGSHHYLKHPDGRATVVPVHSGETIGPGLLRRILHSAGVSAQEIDLSW